MEDGALQVSLLHSACAIHEIFRSRYGLLGAAVSLRTRVVYGTLSAVLCRERYSPSQREQRAVLSALGDDEGLLSSPTLPSLLTAGLAGGCPQEPAPRPCQTRWMEEGLQQSTPAFRSTPWAHGHRSRPGISVELCTGWWNVANIIAVEGMWVGRRGGDGPTAAKGDVWVSGAAARHRQRHLREDELLAVSACLTGGCSWKVQRLTRP